MDPVNTLFWNLVSGWKNLQTLPPVAFSCGQRICILCVSVTPSPTSIQPLNPATSRNNNNNYGGLHACVRAAEDTEPTSPCSRVWVAAADSGFLAQAIFVFFFLLCSVSSSTVCLNTEWKLYAHAPSLLLCFWWISSTTYRPGTWTTVCWVIYNGSVWTQIFLKWCWGRRGRKRWFWYVWTWPVLMLWVSQHIKNWCFGMVADQPCSPKASELVVRLKNELFFFFFTNSTFKAVNLLCEALWTAVLLKAK